MYLKRLEIRGFKSFANNTEIQLKPGINIVIGPNGCGKSNIIDAVRWVLGESNIRNLRGQSNEDVIFNGTDNKKALGVASVEMTIDNSCHSLPVDYNEVTTGRKIYRSGESEFYLNKTRVRLKDITSLFTGTGLGKKGYTIISQGELEQVLNAQGFERRLILEEASGIIKHRQERDEVKRRITATNSDLTRLSDILLELDSRKTELEVKSKKARTYLKVAEECRNLEQVLLSHEINKVVSDLSDRKEALRLKQEARKNIQLAIMQQEQELKEQEQQLENQRNLENDLKEQKHSLESQLSQLKSEVALYEEKIRNCHERIRTAVADQNKYTPLAEKLEQDLATTIRDYDTERQRYTEKCEESQVLAEDISKSKKQIDEMSSHFETSQNLIFEHLNRESNLKSQIAEKEQSINQAREKKERLVIHIEEASARLKNLSEALNKVKQNDKEIAQEIQAYEQAASDWENKKVKITDSIKTMEQEYKQLKRDAINLETKLASIKDMDKNYSGYSEGVKAVLGGGKKSQPVVKGIIGVIGELIDVPPGMEVAVEVAMGRGWENIVVEKADQAQKAIQYLKNNRLGRVTFLPLDILKTQPVPAKMLQEVCSLTGVLGIASRLVAFDPRCQKAIDYLLGRILIVDSMDSGLKVFKDTRYSLRLVTLEGEVINTSGAISGGIKPSRSNSPLQRKTEEKNITRRLEQQRQSINRINKHMEKLSADLAEIETSYNNARNHLMECRFQKDILNRELNKIQSDIKVCTQGRNTDIENVGRLDKRINQLELGIAELEESYTVIRQENEKLSEDLEKNKADVDTRIREYEMKKERLKAYTDQLNMKKKELENMEKNINQFKQVKKSYQDSLEEARLLNDRMNKDIKDYDNRVTSIKSQIVTLTTELETCLRGIASTRQQQQQYAAKASQIRTAIRPRKNELLELEGSTRNIEIHITRLETELEGIQNKWRDRFQSDPPLPRNEFLSAREIKDYKAQISESLKYIEELGPVDISAIEEYEEIKNRYDFMYTQYSDLQEAKIRLENLVQETEKLMIKQFAHFMVLANESFNMTFNQIFGGGEAHLKLESGDKFDAGVELTVKLPGKKYQSLSLLSGGERALTCIALLFALLRLRPAPFCLLDEIDAALDEVNLLRFTSFLKKMAADMQFIVITHRQATIAAGENIYGVTMPEEGVSTVLTVNYNEAESLAG
ncbi:MAG: chromosome segregation protein SMC [Syntrophomonadaceae bacterium]